MVEQRYFRLSRSPAGVVQGLAYRYPCGTHLLVDTRLVLCPGRMETRDASVQLPLCILSVVMARYVFSVYFGRKLTDFPALIYSDSWRLTFMHWRFFSFIQVGAFTSCLLTFVLGILCRVFCFGRGLLQYLNPPDDTVHGFTPNGQWDAEKVDFQVSQDANSQFTKPAIS